MPSATHNSDIPQALERRHARYEIQPYYVMLDMRPERGEPTSQRIQAGFDVSLYGELLQGERLPLDESQDARTIVAYFEDAVREIQSQVGQQCAVELVRYPDSLVLDPQHDFGGQAMLQIRISHTRGLGEPKGPAEDQALQALREKLRELHVKES
ncbi:MAG TPA: hypothetical protein VKX45_01320 [Bryobacteraceae bacterium]|nr:hypothetical protein [Bryobacteraceae bacterium]